MHGAMPEAAREGISKNDPEVMKLWNAFMDKCTQLYTDGVAAPVKIQTVAECEPHEEEGE